MKKIGCILGVWLLVLMQVTAFAESAPAAVREASKSVVRVISETDSGTAFGTGFAIGETSPVSYIVTNYHVVDGAKRVSILLSRDNMIDAEVMTPLPASDIAILRLKSPVNLNPIKLNDSEVKAGTGGYALGFPGDVDALSGAIDQEVKIRSGNIGSQNSIQIYENFQALSVYVLDVTISNGDSGGPFVNDKGEVVGINFAKSNRTDGIGVAIKISELTKVLDQNGIPYIKAQSMKIAWVALIVVGVIFVGAIAFLIIVLVKKHKKAKPVLYCVSGEFMGQRFYLDDGVSNRYALGFTGNKPCALYGQIRKESAGFLCDGFVIGKRYISCERNKASAESADRSLKRRTVLYRRQNGDVQRGLGKIKSEK